MRGRVSIEREPMTDAAIAAWNLSGGDLSPGWIALCCEIYGIVDPESLIRRMAQIRDHFRAEKD